MITGEIPGIDGKDLDIKLLDGILTIKGEKKKKTPPEGLTASLCKGIVEKTMPFFHPSTEIIFGVSIWIYKFLRILFLNTLLYSSFGNRIHSHIFWP